MNENLHQLLVALCESRTSSQIQDVLRQLRCMGDYSDDLLETINQEMAAGNWRCVGLLVIAVQWFPRREFAPVLCDLLVNHKEQIANLEDIADLLGDIQDESSVPFLVRAVEYYQPGDDYCHFNRKVLRALRRIGSPDAIDGLRCATENPEELIREAARQELGVNPKNETAS